MEIKSNNADRFAARPPADLRAALVYGPDQGLVRERAEALTKSVVAELNDPFRVAELDGELLGGDAARLWDEAAAISMLGGRRVVRVRGAGNTLSKIFSRFLDEPPGDALIVVEAGELAKSASLRKAFEDADNAAAIPCYGDNERNLGEVIRSALKAEALAIEPDALAEAVARLGSDRGVTRSELQKLALYVMGSDTVKLADVRAVMGDESELRMEGVSDAAGEGNFVALDTELSRLWQAGASPVGVLWLSMGHFQRLLLVKSESEGGSDTSSAMRKLRPPVHFSRERSFSAQISRWSVARLEQALELLYEAEALVKTTAIPGEAATGRALLQVAALAKGRG